MVPGTTVQVQNQAGPHKNKWNLSGTVVEVLGFDVFTVKMDGLGQVTKRNWKYLRPILWYKDTLSRGMPRARMGLCDSQRGQVMSANTLGVIDNSSCSGYTISVAGGPSDSGGGTEGNGAAGPGTNESSPPPQHATSEAGPATAADSGSANERPSNVQSKGKPAEPAGQRSQQ